jgi:hypothetical protein
VNALHIALQQSSLDGTVRLMRGGDRVNAACVVSIVVGIIRAAQYSGTFVAAAQMIFLRQTKI